MIIYLSKSKLFVEDEAVVDTILTELDRIKNDAENLEKSKNMNHRNDTNIVVKIGIIQDKLLVLFLFRCIFTLFNIKLYLGTSK